MCSSDLIRVAADDTTQAMFNVGTGAAGVAGLGAGVGVLSVANNARASAGGTLAAGGAITVSSNLSETIDQRSYAFEGGIVGLGASVSVMNVRSTSQAFLADGTIVDKAASVAINAVTSERLTAKSLGAQVGAVAGGASFSRVRVSNDGVTDTYAGIGKNARVGTGVGTEIGRAHV